MTKAFLTIMILSSSLFLAGCSGDDRGSGSGRPPPPPRRGGEPVAQPGSAQRPAAGPVAFQAPTVDGRMATVRGPTALFFFTSWCGYCKQAMPEVNRLASQAQARGWRVYGVNVNEPPDKAQWFVQNFRPNFPVLLDSNGQVAAQYGVKGFPTFTLIDANGRVTYNAHELPRSF